MQRNWVHRIHCTLEEAGHALRAKQIAVRCGCVWEDQYASVRHALRRELAKGHLSQDASGYSRRGVLLMREEEEPHAS
jgi:hypothetical protein